MSWGASSPECLELGVQRSLIGTHGELIVSLLLQLLMGNLVGARSDRLLQKSFLRLL